MSIGSKPRTSRVGSPLTDPRPPKPGFQGDAKSSGAGSGTMKPAITKGNTHTANTTAGLRTNSTKAPGSGTRGTGTRNRAPRT